MTSARIIFVAGLSGAGKTQAMKTFEDLGFYCVEHLPPAALDETLRVLDEAQVQDIAVTLDVHGNGALGDAVAAIERAGRSRSVSVLFLDAHDSTLVRRFSETRRRHPRAEEGSLHDAIIAERMEVVPLRELATMTIDTTTMTHGALKERLKSAFSPDDRSTLAVTLLPFGFKYGLPLDLDLLFDVRFLRNPNYNDKLRPFTGDDPAVGAFIEADPACDPFVEKLVNVLDFLIPNYIAEGKAQLTIGIGCTGGRHRSVYIARRLQKHLASNQSISVAYDARDVGRNA